MRAAFLATVVACLATSAVAEDAILKSPGGYVRLSQATCSSEAVRALLREEWRDKFKQGWMEYHGRQIEMCWILDGEWVVVVDAEKDMGRLPYKSFKPEAGA